MRIENFYEPEQYILAAPDWAQLALVEFSSEKPRYVIQPSAENNYLPSLVQYFSHVSAKGIPLSGKVICSLHDAICKTEDNFPKLTFCRPLGDLSCFLLPDPFYIDTSGYLEMHSAIESLNIPWHSRLPLAYFRGSSTGGLLTLDQWMENPRVRLSLLSLKHPDILDSKITAIVQEEEAGVKEQIVKSGIVSNFEPVENCARYRYLVDIDGNANAYSYFLKFCMGSLVFKVESKLEQWFYGAIKPWVHYVPIKRDLSDLTEKLEWAISNDSQAQAIAISGKEFARNVNYEFALDYGVEIVTEALEATKNFSETKSVEEAQAN